MKKFTFLLAAMLLMCSVGVWAESVVIYENTGTVGTDDNGVVVTGNINSTTTNGNPAPSFGCTSAKNAVVSFEGFDFSEYTTLSLTLDAAFKNFPSTTSVWPKVTVTAYLNNAEVFTDEKTITWTEKDNAYSAFSISNIPTFDKLVFTHTPAEGTTSNGKATTNYGAYLDNIKIYADVTINVATPVLTAEEGKVTDGNFTEAFTLTMTCATENALIYYTLDGTDPAESKTAVEYTEAITISAKSTKVRAIAMDGTTADFSREATATYCYVNTAATAYTVSEAIDVIDANLGLGNELCVKGAIKEVQSYNETYHSLTYVITDGQKDLLVYSGLGLNKAEFTGVTDLAVGDDVVVCGKLKLFKETYEFDYNNYLVSHEGTPSGIDDAATEAVKAVKVIENGQMVIIREGVKYNAQGAVIE